MVCRLTIAPQANIDFDKSESITDTDVRLYFNTRKSKKSFRFELGCKTGLLGRLHFRSKLFGCHRFKKTISSKKPTSLSK
jgi:hypothetical protein